MKIKSYINIGSDGIKYEYEASKNAWFPMVSSNVENFL